MQTADSVWTLRGLNCVAYENVASPSRTAVVFLDIHVALTKIRSTVFENTLSTVGFASEGLHFLGVMNEQVFISDNFELLNK